MKAKFTVSMLHNIILYRKGADSCRSFIVIPRETVAHLLLAIDEVRSGKEDVQIGNWGHEKGWFVLNGFYGMPPSMRIEQEDLEDMRAVVSNVVDIVLGGVTLAEGCTMPALGT